MEKIDQFFEKINKNKVYSVITGILFPVILVVFGLIKVNKGLDITDSAFSPYNYLHVDRLNDMWLYSYLYTNFLGAFFSILPMGKTMLGMNIYTGLVKIALALIAYFFFVRRVKVKKEYVFIGILTALGLCWCPTTVMYNYLTYLLFFGGTALLYRGLTEDKKLLLIIAGFLLGSNVFVRFPNLCEAGLILALWYYSFIKKEKFTECLKKTGFCLAGYLIGLVAGFIVIACTRHGINGFFTGIKDLFGMTESATAYAPAGMISGILGVYKYMWSYTEIVILTLILCALISLMLPDKLAWVRYLAVTAISIALIAFLYHRGLFSFAYENYGSIYGPAVLITEISIVFSVVYLIVNPDKNDKLLAMLVVLTGLITPLGSNNALYSNINNGFFVLPVLIYLLVKEKHVVSYFKPLHYALTILVLLVTFQSIFFGVRFVFRDGEAAPMDSKVAGTKAVSGMYTTAKHAEELNGLFEYLKDSDEKILLYGDVSGLAFYLEREIAGNFAWSSLDSYTKESFKSDIDAINASKDRPLVIVGSRDYNEMNSGTLNPKQTILKEFLGNNGYEIGYDSDRLVVLTAGGNGDK